VRELAPIDGRAVRRALRKRCPVGLEALPV
jgi:hypothetical protein